MTDDAEELRVRGDTPPAALGAAIAGELREGRPASLSAVGAAAVNQAMKAAAVARRYLREDGWDLSVVPEFCEVDIEGRVVTALRLVVKARPLSAVSPYASPPGMVIGTEEAARAAARVLGNHGFGPTASG